MFSLTCANFLKVSKFFFFFLVSFGKKCFVMIFGFIRLCQRILWSFLDDKTLKENIFIGPSNVKSVS